MNLLIVISRINRSCIVEWVFVVFVSITLIGGELDVYEPVNSTENRMKQSKCNI